MTIEQSKPAPQASQESTPLTPARCNLQDFPYMPLDVRRLLTSETWILGTGDERAAAMCMWLESWHQIPAASLPNNPRMLAHLSQAGAKWNKVKDQALRGWIACGDGRLYHPVVAAKALEAWIEKLLNSITGAAGNSKRWEIEIDTGKARADAREAIALLRALAPQSKSLKKKAVLGIETGSAPDSAPDSPPDSSADRKRERRESKGISSVPKGTGADGAAPSDAAEPMDERQLAELYVSVASKLPETDAERTREEAAAIWKGGKSCLWLDAGMPTAQGGTLIGKHAKDYDVAVLQNAVIAMCRDRPAGPASWLKRALQLRAGEASKTNKQSRLEDSNAAVVASLLTGSDAPENAQTALEASNAAAVAELLKTA